MNAATCPANVSGTRRRVSLLNSLLLACLALPLLPFAGCTAAQQASVSKATAAIVADAQSPAGQAILADVTTGALNVGLNAASGNDVGAVISGIQGAASAIRDYEGLPTAPSAATIAKAAAIGSGVGKVEAIVAPALETIIGNATKSAATQKVAVSIDAITEAAARGLDAVAAAKVSLNRGEQPRNVAIAYAELPCEAISHRD